MKETIKNISRNYLESTGKAKLAFILFFWICTAFITVVEPLFFAEVIKYLEWYYHTWEFDSAQLITLILYWIWFIILTIIVSYIYRFYLVDKIALKNYLDLHHYFSSKVINMSYDNYLKTNKWSIYKILDRGIMGQFSFIFFIFQDLLKNAVGIVFIIIILFIIDVKMTLLALSMLPVMIWVWYILFARLTPTQKQLNDKWDNVFWVLWDFMTNLSLVKTLSLETYYKNRISKDEDVLMKQQLAVSKWWSIGDIYTGILVMISRILVLWFWIFYVIDGSLSLASLFLFFSYIGWIYFPLSFIFSRAKQVQENLTSVEKMYREFENLENDNDESWIILKNIIWNIEYQNVWFQYNQSKNIFKNLSFTIKPWEKTAFVWNTWAGKSTIVHLLLRFWDIQSWKILLDSRDTKDINKQSLRNHIWVVSQDNSLFNMSIKENLLFAKPKASKKEIQDALQKAEAHFVFELEKWIDTIIGERWLKLSWWEKQRLSIARLFLKNPEILVLDEATSALDNKTEKQVHKALDTLMNGRTSIIIAHRLSTIQNADSIYVLENWEIVESWNYTQLMKNKAKFYKLSNPDNLIIN